MLKSFCFLLLENTVSSAKGEVDPLPVYHSGHILQKDHCSCREALVDGRSGQSCSVAPPAGILVLLTSYSLSKK